MSGLMVALSLIRSLVFLHLELGSLLTRLMTAGVVGGGVMLIVFALRVQFRPVGVSVLFLGLFSPVQRAELWGVILALQSFCVVHMGVDNLGVVRHVGRLLDGSHGSPPLELVHDGDLFSLLQRMLHLRSLDTVRITKVKGHADEGMVLDVRVREDDKLGNAAC